MKEFVEVAVCLPVSGTFFYRVPERMKSLLETGMRVLVPFRERKVTGIVLNFYNAVPEEVVGRILEVDDLLDNAPVITPAMLRFFRWISNYYLYPLGEVIRTGLPPALHVESRSVVKLTQKGIDSLREGKLDSLRLDIFEKIGTKGKISLSGLLKLYPGRLTRTQIFTWRKEGFLQVESELLKRGIKPKIQKFLQYIGGVSDKRLSEKSSKILEWLESKITASYSEVCKEFKSPSRAIQTLVKMGLIRVVEREICRDDSIHSELASYPVPDLTPQQKDVLAEIVRGIRAQKFSPFLIYGVTGSGKTEIYLRAIEEVLAQGKEVIVLVPEISLTPQLLSRFTKRFGRKIALLHSGLGRAERYDQWRKIWKGEVSIAIGARSAIFAPFRKLGMIIVDEEHEASYKQEEKLKYNARDLAVVRAKQADATLILGSATPSLESYCNAERGKFRLLTLPERVEGKPLPKVEIVDMKKGDGLLSEPLKNALQKNLAEGNQSLLFLNRRGFARFILCPDCGFVFKCPNCSLTLTFHLRKRCLRCHYCDYQIHAPGDCPMCGSYRLRDIGAGTERLEEEIKSIFPVSRVERMDRDTTRRLRSHHRILKRLESGEIDILVGTQMIVKGHDFPNVTFVGVVSADTSLHFPDFRASERTFQLLTQVAGRAGRGETPGEVIIQTFNPDHYSISRARDHDYEGFYRDEIQFRKALGYPPFFRLINFRLLGNSEKKTRIAAEEMGRIGRLMLEEGYGKDIDLIGPSSAPFSKIRGKFRWQMLAKGRSSERLHRFATELAARTTAEIRGKGVTLDIDVDPVFIL